MKVYKINLTFLLAVLLICALAYLPMSALADDRSAGETVLDLADEEGDTHSGNSARDTILIYITAGVVSVGAILGLSTVFKRTKFKQKLAEYKKNFGSLVQEDGGSVLFFARDKQEARGFIREGFAVNTRNKRGETPIFTAQDSEVVRELINNGADVGARDYVGNTALFRAYNKDKAKELVEAGVDVNTLNDDGYDAASSLREVQEILREKIGDPTYSDHETAAVLHGQIRQTLRYLSEISSR